MPERSQGHGGRAGGCEAPALNGSVGATSGTGPTARWTGGNDRQATPAVLVRRSAETAARGGLRDRLPSRAGVARSCRAGGEPLEEQAEQFIRV